jgi:hypothetical protein
LRVKGRGKGGGVGVCVTAAWPGGGLLPHHTPPPPPFDFAAAAPCTAWPAARCCLARRKQSHHRRRPTWRTEAAPRGGSLLLVVPPLARLGGADQPFPRAVFTRPSPPYEMSHSHPPRCGRSVPSRAYFSSRRSSRSSTVSILSRLSLPERCGMPRRDAEAAAALSPTATLALACACTYTCYAAQTIINAFTRSRLLMSRPLGSQKG